MAAGGSRFFKDYAVLAGGQVVRQLLSFAAFALLARVLEPEGYGQVEYIVGLSVFFAMLVEGGLGVVGVRRAAQDRSLIPTLAFQIPAARLMIAALAAPAMVVTALLAMKSAAPAPLIWLFAASLFFAPFKQEWLLQATERMSHAAALEVIRASVFALAVWSLVRSPDHLASVGWAEVMAVAAANLTCVAMQHWLITPVRLRGSFGNFADLMREGAPAAMTNLVWALNQSAPLLLVGGLLGGVQVALFGAAGRLAGSLLTFSNLYHYNLFPSVTRAAVGDREELARLLARSLRVAAWAGVFVALGLTLLAEPVVRIIFGPKLTGAAPLLQILAWTFPITLCSGHARWSLVAVGAQTQVLQSQVAGLVAIVATSLALGHEFGSLGYAAGAIAGTIATWLASHAFAARRGNAPPPFANALRPFALGAVTVAACEGLALGPWLSILGLAAFVAAAPLLDRRLVGDLIALGGAKRDRVGGAPSA